MRYYLDTNCVRQIKRFKNCKEDVILTSALSIFEIISGITSEKEYIKRKNILKSIKNSPLEILWELPRTILIKSFGLPIFDTDVKATHIMMEEIINSLDYDSALKIRFNLKGEDYTIKTFNEHDTEVNRAVQVTINNAIGYIKKDERKTLNKTTIDDSLLEIYKEDLIRKFLMTALGTRDVTNVEYIKSIETYFENPQLNNLFTLSILLPSKSLAKGMLAGSNDGMDYQHLSFTHNIDFFVSDDNFYIKIMGDPDISQHLDFEFIKLESALKRLK